MISFAVDMGCSPVWSTEGPPPGFRRFTRSALCSFSVQRMHSNKCWRRSSCTKGVGVLTRLSRSSRWPPRIRPSASTCGRQRISLREMLGGSPLSASGKGTSPAPCFFSRSLVRTAWSCAAEWRIFFRDVRCSRGFRGKKSRSTALSTETLISTSVSSSTLASSAGPSSARRRAAEDLKRCCTATRQQQRFNSMAEASWNVSSCTSRSRPR
mmetsp:Transcript_29007/g.67211  ORF Transcript_29007/g.67211 Transcript_29007/m.67211 type:complete len:211 (-) Transcript_29007:505-1137(-)